MALAFWSVQPDPAGIREFRSVRVPALQTNALGVDSNAAPVHLQTTTPSALTPRAWLSTSPGSTPRSVSLPLCHMNA